MRKHEFVKVMLDAIAEGADVSVGVTSPDLPYPEVITNRWENLKVKLAYYVDAYNGHMQLKANTNISIDSVVAFHSDLGKENYEVKNNG